MAYPGEAKDMVWVGLGLVILNVLSCQVLMEYLDVIVNGSATGAASPVWAHMVNAVCLGSCSGRTQFDHDVAAMRSVGFTQRK